MCVHVLKNDIVCVHVEMIMLISAMIISVLKEMLIYRYVCDAWESLWNVEV